MRRVKGSTTVEMALLMPMIFLVFLLVVRTTFYYHDKSILNGIAYETLTVAVQTARNPKPEEADAEAFCREKAQGKLIYFSSPEVSLESTKEMAKIRITASRGKNEDPGITAGERTASGEKDPSEEKSGVEQITGEMNDEYKL